MSLGNFEACLAFTLRPDVEGGFSSGEFDNDGGGTNFGITLYTLSEWRGYPVTVDDVRALEITEARQIYRARYWQPNRCDDLPRAVDLSVFDMGVNAGVARSARMLQAALGGLVQDGIIGPKTLMAANAADPREVVQRLYDRHVAYYVGLDNHRYEKGWIRRAARRRDTALRML